MIARLARWLLSLRGWKVIGTTPTVPKFVIIAAPHTTNWDFPITLLAATALNMRVKWLAKHTLFKFPFGGIMRALGGIPVDRTASHNMVENAIQILKDSTRLGLIVPPEGTRSKSTRWRTGFYHIAKGAHVPIVCGFLDYRKKEGGIGLTFIPTGDIEADMQQLRTFYGGITGKHPENTSVIELASERTHDVP
jgi:1-acyl-sn-glycerol-3-phosphate acyltransferase